MIHPTALRKLGAQNEIAKKWKMNDFSLKENGKYYKVGHTIQVCQIGVITDLSIIILT